ncbi:hypothetical protein [Cardinium endosymbiont of Sogatella furcifera]|uniref:hypothetical protein n=1 Tax=Cardinium endosymbiont of Sogatella furcifera TaxID=650378 RepID=UPI000E0D4F36|nr:hypothetical protein [Cardinium endosymbiont of Sogatella furcifera]
MKKTKNKIIKGVKVLVNGPLYCALFFSLGLDCGQEKPKSILDARKPIDTEPNNPPDSTSGEPIDLESDDPSNVLIDQENDLSNQYNIGNEQGEDNPAFESSPTHSTDDPKDVSAQPDEEAVSVPPSQPSNSSPKVVVEESSSKTNKTNKPLMPGQQNGSKSSNKLDPKNTTPVSPKKKEARCNPHKVTDPKSSEVNRDRLDHVKTKNNTQAKPQPSGAKRTTSHSSNDIINPDVQKKLDELSNLLDEVEKKLDTLKPLMNEEEKNNEKGVVRQTEEFLKANCIEDVKDRIKSWTQEEQKEHVKILLKLTQVYEKELNRKISKKLKQRKSK